MSIVVYKCTECKRTKDIGRNIHGLESVQRCTITNGCRGTLYQINILPDFLRGEVPAEVAGLSDYLQRRVLYNFYQTVSSNKWRITHNLGTIPTIRVYFNKPTETNSKNIELVSDTEYTIEVIDANNLNILFSDAYSGMAQLITLTSDQNITNQPILIDNTPKTSQISNDREFSIAIRASKTASTVMKLKMLYRLQNTTETEIIYAVDNVQSILSPWRDYTKISVKGITYEVRSFQALPNNMVSNSDILVGANVIFSGVDYHWDGVGVGAFTEFNSEDILLLMSNAPYQIVDPLYDSYVDILDVSDGSTSLYYDGANYFVNNSSIKKIYPYIYTIE